MGGSWKKAIKNLRCSSIVLGVSNVVVMFLGAALMAFNSREHCSGGNLVPFIAIMATSSVRIFAMIRCAVHQQAAAVAILGSSPENPDVSNDVSRLERRLKYKRWLCWTRFATFVTVVQSLLAMFLLIVVYKMSNSCILGMLTNDQAWKQALLIGLLITVSFVPILQCFSSADVLRWRSFYEMQDNAWKAHYEEVFDHGIREAFCCLGRSNYLRTMEDDEVYSVAQLLGDLVTYRASGTGHLELLAGLALLQRHNQHPQLDENSVDAPDDEIHTAIAFHAFAEAAYTGPLLDVGRNPILFPCAWLYRQGILTAWCRNRRPVLQGDNWWRGHAAAFIKYAKISSESLRRGRVNQGKCQAAYFILVLHHIRSVVVAIRGTETPEDLITDGLGRETSLTMEDLDGLINGVLVDPMMKQNILLSFPHYGHSGIVVAARELHKQIEGSNSDDASNCGFLSSLLGEGCECEGYAVRIVGHSLGGAIAAMLGIRLHGRFPDLHVYSYGSLPCVDSVVAVACSTFITCIVHDSEFSSYLSLNSILRLRAAALASMSQGTTIDIAMINKLAQLFVCVSRQQKTEFMKPSDAPGASDAAQSFMGNNGECSFMQDESQVKENCNECIINDSIHDLRDTFSVDGSSINDPVSEFMNEVPSTESKSAGNPPEVYLAGLVIHLIRQHRGIIQLPLLTRQRDKEIEAPYRAILADRENFKEILISPYMFLDHLPWRCKYALMTILKSRERVKNRDKHKFFQFFQFLRAS